MNTDIAAAAWNEAPASLLEENTTRPTAPTEGLINQRIAPKKDCKAPLPQAPLATKIDHLASHGSLNVLDQNRLILRESIHRGIEVTKERVKGGRVVGLGDEQRDDKRAYYEQERGAASASIHHSTTRIITLHTPPSTAAAAAPSTSTTLDSSHPSHQTTLHILALDLQRIHRLNRDPSL